MELTVGLILCFAGVTIIYLTTKEDDFISFFAILFIVLGVLFLRDYTEQDHPTAMDVYQGKTTLEITYKDGVAVDSTVVFKQN